jgi:hypothetical protein
LLSGKEDFFFEKKKQKTFESFGRRLSRRARHSAKDFLVLFSKNTCQLHTNALS